MIDRDKLIDRLKTNGPVILDDTDAEILADLVLELDVQAPIGNPETTEIINGWLVDTSGDEPEPLINLRTLNGWPGRRIREIILGTDWTDEQARDLGRQILREIAR